MGRLQDGLEAGLEVVTSELYKGVVDLSLGGVSYEIVQKGVTRYMGQLH